jgi:hypothetical protein
VSLTVGQTLAQLSWHGDFTFPLAAFRFRTGHGTRLPPVPPTPLIKPSPLPRIQSAFAAQHRAGSEFLCRDPVPTFFASPHCGVHDSRGPKAIPHAPVWRGSATDQRCDRKHSSSGVGLGRLRCDDVPATSGGTRYPDRVARRARVWACHGDPPR